MLHFLRIFTYLFFALKISMSDLTYRKIRNKDLLLFIAASFLVNLPTLGLEVLQTLSVSTLLLSALHLLSHGQIGAGDLKLFLALVIWSTNFMQWLALTSAAWVFGGLFAITLLLLKRRATSNIAFAPFIFLAFIAVI